MKVYTVLSIDDFCGAVCSEPYATLDLAFERAKELANEFCGDRFVMPESVDDIDPEDVRMNNDHGNIEYLICDGETGNMSISILEQDLITLQQSRNEKEHHYDEPGHWSLPAGWDKHHRPIFMQAVYDDPDCLLPLSELTDNEKFALTIARISDRPNYSFTFGSTTWNQTSALEELSRDYRTWASYDIMENEIQQLQKIFDNYVNQSKAV